MSIFKGIKRVFNEAKEDEHIIRAAKAQQPVFNTGCRFQDFGFYTVQTMAFYTPVAWTNLPQEFTVCRECFAASIAPTVLVRHFVRKFKSSKDPETSGRCWFACPQNKPAWRAAAFGGQIEPFMQCVRKMVADEKSTSLCPSKAQASAEKSLPFYVMRSQIDSPTPFKICPYHYNDAVPPWLQAEFAEWPQNEGASCEYELAGSPASTALMLARRTQNFKIFWDFVQAYQAGPHCSGVILPGAKKYGFPGVAFTTEHQVQFCESCYRQHFEPHHVLQLHVAWMELPPESKPAVCSIDAYSLPQFQHALLKTTWKQDPNVVLSCVRDYAPVPNCPGDACPAARRLWYVCEGIEEFYCCELCFHSVVLPSTILQSFSRLALSSGATSHTCSMRSAQSLQLFTQASEAKDISVLQKGIEQHRAEQRRLEQERLEQQRLRQEQMEQQRREKLREEEQELEQRRIQQELEQKQREQVSQPPYSASGDTQSESTAAPPGAANDAQASKLQEIIALEAEAERVLQSTKNDFIAAMKRRQAAANMMSIATMGSIGTGSDGLRYNDGHGLWFDTKDEARASAQEKLARRKQDEAQRRMEDASARRQQLKQARLALAG